MKYLLAVPAAALCAYAELYSWPAALHVLGWATVIATVTIGGLWAAMRAMGD